VRYQERCGDCGGDVGEQKVSKRSDTCDDCWERRRWVVTNLNKITKYFGMKDFQALQRSMAYRTGTAKRKILKMMKELPLGNEVESDIELTI